MKRNDLVFFGILAAGFAAFVLYGRAPAANAAASYEGKPELVAATFSSLWCSACKIVKPRVVRIMPSFAGDPVKFVEYDLSFGPDGAPRAAAANDGLSSVYDRFSTATGYTLLIDADTGEIVDMLTVETSPEQMRAAIRSALAKAEATPPPA